MEACDTARFLARLLGTGTTNERIALEDGGRLAFDMVDFSSVSVYIMVGLLLDLRAGVLKQVYAREVGMSLAKRLFGVCLLGFAACFVVVVLGCGRREIPADPEALRKLREAAKRLSIEATRSTLDAIKLEVSKLAREEMRRFNETEQLYKNDVKWEPFPLHPYNWGMYRRKYLVYETYRTVDILRTESLLLPYRPVVEYEAKVYATREYTDQDKNPEEQAEKETEFVLTRAPFVTTLEYRLTPELEWDGQPGKEFVPEESGSRR